MTPAQLKKLATGKGNADKTAMVTSAMKAEWEAPSDAVDDQADAWWLWTICCALEGRWAVNDTVIRKELLESLK